MRKAVLSFIGAILLAYSVAPLLAADPPFRERRPLRVVLYPFVPDKVGLFRQIEQSFESAYPQIDLKIIDLSANYYDESTINAVTNTDADVLELDSVFIDDFIAGGRIQPIPSTLRASTKPMLQVAEAAVVAQGSWYGVPHWVCTNFLFFKQGDPLGGARTLDDVKGMIGVMPSDDKGLLIDMKGRSTLGELYLDALLDKHQTFEAAGPYLTVETIDKAVVEDLKTTRTLCESTLCRDSDYHNMAGFYARQFAQQRGRALAGYLERLYYVGTEALTGCRKNGCLLPSQVSVAPLPLSQRGSQPFAWVDSFTISSGCAGQCLLDAEAFIRHVASTDEVRKQLTPGYGEAPRYLMPAVAALYSDAELLKVAPLYGKLHPTIQDAIAVRRAGLNSVLRSIGNHLDKKELPQ